MHALGSDRLVEAAHLSLEECLAVAVRGRIASENVPAIGDEFPSDRASDLVAWLAPVDHRPSPFAELRVRARGEDRLSGFGEEELHVLPSLAVKRLVGAAFLPGAFLLVPARVDNRGEAAVGRELRGLREPARLLDCGVQSECAPVVDAMKLHEGQHPWVGKDDLGDLSGKILLALEEPVVVVQQRLELLLGEAADLRLGDHRAERGGLGRAALDRELVSLAAADIPDPVRDTRHLLRRIAVGEHDVSVLGVLA